MEVVADHLKIARLLPEWITPVSPMRGKEALKGEKRLGEYTQPMCSQREIVAKDYLDVKRCDAVLADLRSFEGVSIGSMFELAWAYECRKPVVLLMEEGNVHDHPFVREACVFRARDYDEAADLLVKLLCEGVTE